MPITCPNCGHQNRDTVRFCGRCGTAMPASAAKTQNVTGLLSSGALLAGRYQILHKIGQGGMAAVYLVQDLRLAGKRWAVKEMSDAAIADPQQKARAVAMFQREMQLLTQLQHRNIPQVVDTFTEGGKYFIVMEYVDGLTLEQVIKQQGGRPCPEAQVKAWLQQLCSVLDYLHTQNPPVVFRDLKPSNIMVDRSGTIRLIDFGVARFFLPQKTQDTQFFGTAGYAAPEQYGQQGQSDARSDVYGLGTTLYRLLTGYDPAENPLLLPPIDSIGAHISPAMRQVIQRAVERDRARRWPSIRAMAAGMGIPIADHTAVQAVPQVVLQGPKGTQAVFARPTTKLLVAVAKMSNGQLALLAGVLALVFALGTVLLVPRISLELALAFPLYLVAGPMAYAASQRRGAAFAAHVVVTGTVWLVANHWVDIGSDLWLFVVGLLLSGLVMEGLLVLQQPARKALARSKEAWWLDCLWLAGMTAIAGLVALGIPSVFGHYNWLRPWYPLSAALTGALGWFLGDLYHQNVLLKQQGLGRSALQRH